MTEVEIIRRGGIGVMPTDTLYGVVGSAILRRTVLRVYAVKKRDLKKPMIVLVASVGDLRVFGVKLNASTREILSELWPGPVSVILPCTSKKFLYLHRGTKSIAFRLPKDAALREFLAETGPLVAPSANPEGKPSAKTIPAARRYFGEKVDFYVDAGEIKGRPSRLVMIRDGKVVIVRA